MDPGQLLLQKYPVPILVLAIIGLWLILKAVVSFLWTLLSSLFASGVSLKKYGAGKGSYALITGSTDGIGLEFARKMAKSGMNLILVSRTLSKLEAVASEIKNEYKVKVEVLPIDFTKFSEKDEKALRQVAEKYEISVLVNNVATNHSIPTSFMDESEQVLEDIIKVNILYTVKLTKILIEPMQSRKNGLILNIGSFGGLFPTPLLQTYSGSKAFLKYWSEALAAEAKPFGIFVQHLNTYFVVSNMSKIKRSSALIPTASDYVSSVMKKLGTQPNITPYPSHALMAWVMENLVSKDFLIQKIYEMQKDIRKRALKKMEKQK